MLYSSVMTKETHEQIIGRLTLEYSAATQARGLLDTQLRHLSQLAEPLSLHLRRADVEGVKAVMAKLPPAAALVELVEKFHEQDALAKQLREELRDRGVTV